MHYTVYLLQGIMNISYNFIITFKLMFIDVLHSI